MTFVSDIFLRVIAERKVPHRQNFPLDGVGDPEKGVNEAHYSTQYQQGRGAIATVKATAKGRGGRGGRGRPYLRRRRRG